MNRSVRLAIRPPTTVRPLARVRWSARGHSSGENRFRGPRYLYRERMMRDRPESGRSTSHDRCASPKAMNQVDEKGVGARTTVEVRSVV
jgi:hypothetical protein